MEMGDNNINNPNPIKTMVVLVQENRSFDHILGWMKQLNPNIDGVTGHESNPISTSDPNSTRVKFGNNSVYVDPDPGHSFQDIYEQVFGEAWSQESAQKSVQPTMHGFVQNANRKQTEIIETVMNGFEPDLIPVYKELVSEFGVCDRWFASIPTSTQPNRLYVHSATSHGLSRNDSQQLRAGLPQKTIFDSLDEAGFTFGIYYQSLPSIFCYRNLRQLKYRTKFHPYDLTFKNHCKEGKLPNYVVIEQRYFDLKSSPGNDDHPSHDIYEGQKLIKDVYETLRSSPQWNEMLFVIIYDEHGGFFDHVPTPTRGVPNPDGRTGHPPYNFKFDRLGVRVPAIFVSPWIQPGTVLHEPTGPDSTSQYEHSSIPATVKKIFNLESFLTKRDAWAGTFERVINRTTPRTDCPVKLAEPIRLRNMEAIEEKKLSDFQKELVEIAACLRGDDKKDSYPDKLVENMTVAQAAAYCHQALQIFFHNCNKAKQHGVHHHKTIFVGGDNADESI